MGCHRLEGEGGSYCGVVIAASCRGSWDSHRPKHVVDMLCVIDNIVVLQRSCPCIIVCLCNVRSLYTADSLMQLIEKQYSMNCMSEDSLTEEFVTPEMGRQSQQRGLNRASALFHCWTELYICTSPPPTPLMMQRSRHVLLLCCAYISFVWHSGEHVSW